MSAVTCSGCDQCASVRNGSLLPEAQNRPLPVVHSHFLTPIMDSELRKALQLTEEAHHRRPQRAPGVKLATCAG